jgi:hypothetical protein
MPKDAKSKKKKALPRQLLAIGNKDKTFHEKWDDERDPLNFPHPFRMILTGPPNTGKSTCIKNIIIRADPPFKKVVIVHADHNETKEYEDLGENGVTMTSSIPDPSGWDPSEKTLAVIDDIDLTHLTKQQKSALDRLFGYVSTHKNTSVASCGQEFFSQPTAIRRMANVLVLWKSPDERNMKTIAARVGMPDLREFMMRFCPDFRDSLWIDSTFESPYPLRINGYKMLPPINQQQQTRVSDYFGFRAGLPPGGPDWDEEEDTPKKRNKLRCEYIFKLYH